MRESIFGIITENAIGVMNLLIAVVMTACVIGLLRKGGLWKAVVWGISFFTLACYLDEICYLVMVGIADDKGQGQWRDDAIYLVGMLVSKVMMGTLIYVGKNLLAEKEELTIPRDNQKLSYIESLTICVSFFFLVLLAGVNRTVGLLGNEETVWKVVDEVLDDRKFILKAFGPLLLFLIVLCGYYISAFWYYRKEIQRQVARQKEVEKKKADAYLYTIESNYQRTRELWHDLKNHIGLLDLLLQEEKYAEMKDYLHIFSEDVDEITLPVKSGNLIVDAVLADKISQARKEGVPVNLELCDFSGLSLKPDEVCSLLGNLLDNAIEACRLVETDRRIEVQCKAQENSYYISVRNSAKEKYQDFHQYPTTTKEDMRNGVGHGLGLRSVERVVNRYAGDLLVDSQAGEFVVVVRLPR